MISQGEAAVNQAYTAGSPYASLKAIDPDIVAFGAGLTLSSYPKLYDIFNDFVFAVDPQDLYNTIYQGLLNDPITTNLLQQMANDLNDEVNEVSIPKVKAYLRGINAVSSSSLPSLIARLENTKNKEIARQSATLRAKAMELAQARWAKILEWNGNVVQLYGALNKLYFSLWNDYTQLQAQLNARNALWDFDVLEHQKSLVGVLNGAAAAPDRKWTTMDTIGSILGAAGSVAGVVSGIMAL